MLSWGDSYELIINNENDIPCFVLFQLLLIIVSITKRETDSRIFILNKLQFILTEPVSVYNKSCCSSNHICGRGGIGRHVRLRGVCASVPVQVRSAAPELSSIEKSVELYY